MVKTGVPKPGSHTPQPPSSARIKKSGSSLRPPVSAGPKIDGPVLSNIVVPNGTPVQYPVLRERGFYSDVLNVENEPRLINETNSTLFGGISQGAKKLQPLQSEVATEKHTPFASSFAQIEDINDKISNSRPKKTTQVFQESDFAENSYKPKVQVPFYVLPGKCPRKVEIERKKRTYQSLSLPALLKQHKIATSKLMPKHVDPSDFTRGMQSNPENPFPIFLPLHIFDNTEYDSRTPSEWVETGIEQNNVAKPVPALCLLPKKDELPKLDPKDPSIEYDWFEVGVLSYDETEERFLVQKVNAKGRVGTDNGLNKSGVSSITTQTPLTASQYWVPRIQLMFEAEDPEVFALRIKEAYEERHKTEAHLRYHLYLDCMPMDGVTELGDDSFKRMCKFAMETPCFAKQAWLEHNQELQSVLPSLRHEVNIDYTRTLNRLIFDKIVAKNANTYPYIRLPKEEMEKRSTIRYKGKHPDVPEVDFASKFDAFTFESILTRTEAIAAIMKVRYECNEVSSRSLFHVPILKQMKVEEFLQTQSQTTSTVSLFLRDQWKSTLTNEIRAALRDVGRGWFNLYETNWEVYQISKLKKFMEMVKFCMQDSLRFLVQDSLVSFVQMIVDASQSTFDLDENYKWDSPLHSSPFRPKKNPLFSIELALDSEGSHYNVNLPYFETMLVELFDTAIKSTQTVPQLEKFVMKDIFWADTALLESVGEHEKHIDQLRDDMCRAVKQSLIPLIAYARANEQFLELINTDINAFIKDYDSQERTAAEVKAEVDRFLAEKDRLEALVPSNVVIGPFYVNVEPVRKNLSKKCRDLANAVLELLAKKLRTQADESCEQFKLISRKLHEKPNTIEDLTEMREWIATIPNEIKKHKETIDKAMDDYQLIEEFNYNLSQDDFNAKYTALFWPNKIEEQVHQTEENLQADEERFRKLQQSDQASFQERIDSLQITVAGFAGYTDRSKAVEIGNDVRRVHKSLQQAQIDAQLYNQRERLFDQPVTNYEVVNKLIRDFEPFRNLWMTASEWVKWHESWMNDVLESVDAEQVESCVTNSFKNIHKAVKSFKDIPSVQDVAQDFKQQIEEFKPYIPLIQGLRNPGMRMRHWEKLSEDLGFKVIPKKTLTFSKCLEMNLQDHIETIAKIAEVAGKEYSIEQALNKMEKDWAPVAFEVMPYKESGTYILKSNEECSQLLDDHIVMTQSMSFSPFKKPFEERINNWETKMRLTQDVLDEWLNCQRSWLYLEPIFSSDDINRQLPVEGKRYQTMERMWRRLMKEAKEKPQVIQLCPEPRKLENLRECNKLLDQVQKGLSEYLETKRNSFPRFYFLSDDELLEILSQTKDPTAVQPHLRKCFENVAKLEFHDDLKITSMYSGEGENVPFCRHIYPQGNVEDWMLKIEDLMKDSVREQVKLSLAAYKETPRTEWVLNWPGQVVIAGAQTYWTEEVSLSIEQHELPKRLQILTDQIGGLVGLVRGKLTKIGRMILSALIVIEVHARDVCGTLVEEDVQGINDFEWISQLRYYWLMDNNPDGDLYTKAVNARFNYGYEYLGNTGRLVVTPLTDRCYLTLTGALNLQFGGAPAGPAGTGKTETTKDLAKAFAIQCVVFNCSDQLDYLAMGKFFKGLASSGAWACFDEFNRIDIEVLSVVAQQIATIQRAQQQRLETFQFEGVELALKPSCAVFITMNPGYAGRTELPDNLKALFRPMAMMVPNYTMIAEISLYSFGFDNARGLANKITATFKLSSEQLSSQDHYDFGMRAVKTVISAAGNLKREHQEMDEELICLRAIRDVNVPKFLVDDLKLFNGVVSDLFPTIKQESIDYGDLENALRKTCLYKLDMKDVDGFVLKCIQLYETTVVRHGLMLVGPTCSGKTRCYNVLQAALTSLKGQPAIGGGQYEQVHTYVLNPKSITMGQLYGEFDLLTHEWTDGILSSLIRVGTTAQNEDKRWYMFDGPVDAVWIENMNTVLDDNKKLCLSSGEIIKLTEAMTMMFEVADLAVASPATVSRCGMVYLEPSILGLSPFVFCWLRRLPEVLFEHKAIFERLFEIYLEPAINFLRAHCKEIVASVDGCLTFSMLKLLECFFTPFLPKEGERPLTQEVINQLPTLIEPWFIFSLVWSIGATCDEGSREKFNNWLQQAMKDNDAQLKFPDTGLVYDYLFDDGGLSQGESAEDEGEEDTRKEIGWVNWMKGAENFAIAAGTAFADMMVPTLDTIRSAYIIHMLITNKKPLLCLGPTGTGKTLTIADKLLKNMPQSIVTEFFTFSARTSSNQTQDLIDSKLDKRRKGIFGPPLGKTSVFFIDDLNMPALETYGAQPPIELIRQFMDHSGWYDRKSIGTFRTLVDITFLGAMGPPGGGRNPVTQRLTRHFNYLSFTEMEDSSKLRIFSIILKSWLLNSPLGMADVEKITSESIDVYNTIVTQLLPTPAKSHYTFNLRDLSKVFQGMLMVDPAKIETTDQLFRLWYHENLRVFQDRLINDQDRTWFSSMLDEKLTTKFGLNLDSVLNQKPVLYGDFLQPNSDVKLYAEIEDHSKMSAVLKEYLDDYNQINTARMNLVLFMDAIQHVCRISRVIRQPMGNALLLGVGGSGRQSLSKLATHMAEYDLFQIELTKNYGNNEWREDLKSIMMKAGLENKSVVFLFPDTQIKSESFLEDINNILNAGDVPNIYQNDEPDRINTAMRPIVIDMGQQPTKSNLFSAYTKRVRSNLHLILCMSPIGEIFRARLRQFPALVNCCTIDWFSEWPEEALQSVAHSALQEMGELDATDEELDGMKQICVNIHQGVAHKSEEYLAELARYNYVTPTSYLELLSIFAKLAGIKKLELKTARDRTKTGLTKLLATAEDVAKMEEELIEMQPLLEEASKETETTMEKIAVDSVVAEDTKKVVEKEEAEASQKATKSQAIAEDAQRDLDEALPALEAALSSLRSLNKNDVIEVRAMTRPPQGVRMVMEAVCIMKGVKPKKVAGEKPGQKIDDYWDAGKLILQDPNKFLESLFNFDKDNIPDDVIKKIHPYMENEEFLPSAIAKVSKACTSLCQWVRAMHKYHFVAKNVAPKRAALAEAQAELAESQRILDAAKAKLYEVQEGIATLQAKLNECVSKKEELERKTNECQQRLVRAGKLIGGLADEKDRWQSSVAMLEEKLKRFVGNVMISAGYVAYLGTFTGKYRNDLLQLWSQQLVEFKVPHTDDLGLIETMGDPVKIRSWQICGLPKDQLSTENGVIVQYSNRWSLFIDPQGQANKWIKTLEKGAGIDVFKLSDKDFLRSLENSIRFGKPCLMENVLEELDPALEPILLKQTFKQQGSLVIRLGDAVIPYHEDFKFYITTKLPNPHYTPEISTKVTLVNFTLSPSGLEDQLLARVVAEERPDLEDAKNQLIVSNAKMKAELKEIEDKILERLSASEGNPVDDVDLIKTLEASKIKSKEIKDKVVVAEQTEKDIDETRSLYIPVSVRTQILFFCTTDLANVDPMYQYSLEWFINLFLNGIANAERADTVPQRIDNINNFFTYSLYINVCRSLFEKDKLMFAFLLAIRIMTNEGLIDAEEWRYFISGGTKRGKEVDNPAPDWLSERAWGDCITLSALPAFEEITLDFAELIDGYKAIFDSNEPHRVPLPGKWNEKLSMFQKLIVLKCLRADMVTNSMQDFVAANLGQRFIEPQTTDLSSVYKDSSPTTPLIFVLSTGTDPAADLNKFAEEMRMAKKFNSISLGQGQGPVAEALARSAIERGRWVFFQNCHLAPSWMPSLERMIEQIDPDKVHRDFRLWLTSMPSPKFPVSALQNSSKMTVEPPKGIKANLIKSYIGLSDDLLNSTGEKTHDFKSLVFSLCLFHGALLERRKFGPLGFNIPYEFTDGDLKICLSQLKMFLMEYPIIPYKVLSYTAGHINYGGRVTDDWDRRCMMNILADYYNENVLQTDHQYSQSGLYYQISTDNDHNGYLQYVKSLPINDTPEIFGLHDNANITFAQNETFNVLAAIVKLQPKTRSGGGLSPEEIIENTAVGILEKVPKPVDAAAVLEKYPVMYEESMNTVLVQEIIRYNRLLSVIHSSLGSLKKALKGLVVMSDQLEKLSNNLFINKVPDMWAGKAYPSLKPLAAWVTDLVHRMDFLQKWVEHGIPPAFWISGFFFPQAFLTGTLQNFARKYHISIDTISFGFEVIKTVKDDLNERPESGCYIFGLYLEGCRWGYEEHQLIESRPKELYTEMPVIWLKPVENRKVPATGIYNCPVYKTLTRAGTLSTTGHSTNFVLPMEIPTDKPQNHWIKRGVALICALDY